MKTGVIAKPCVWLYAENLTDVADELLMGWAVGIIEEESAWLKVVTHYGYCGYLLRDNIRFLQPEELRCRDASGQIVYINRAFADVMERPRVQARILTTLGRGAFVRTLAEQENGYRKVELADRSIGYVPCVAYACRRDNDGYLYEREPETYFLRQMCAQTIDERTFREQAVRSARSYLGTQYRWGGKSSAGIDCSGMTFMSYQMNGILIYRDASMPPEYPVREISRKRMRPGDLIYFPGHVAMYIGGCRYIHCTGNQKSFACVVNSLSEGDADYRKDLAEQILAVGSIF